MYKYQDKVFAADSDQGYRVAKMNYLYRSFSAKEPYD